MYKMKSNKALYCTVGTYEWMVTIAETANVTYRLSFADQGKQLPFSVFRVYLYIELAEIVDIYIYI
jgi:hypothetical protein